MFGVFFVFVFALLCCRVLLALCCLVCLLCFAFVLLPAFTFCGAFHLVARVCWFALRRIRFVFHVSSLCFSFCLLFFSVFVLH